MARIRSIKPEFWTSEQVMECSMNTRLMFIGMWNFADDLGRMPYSPKTIKAQIFPSDDLTADNVRGMILELSAKGLVLIYAVDSKEFLQITGWSHQRIDKPQKPKYPAPFFDGSGNVQRILPPDRIGEDRKGEEGKGKEDAAGAAILDFGKPPTPPAPTNLEKQYFDRSVEVLGKDGRSLAAKLLKTKSGQIPLARAALEQASTKTDPREYVGACIRGNDPGGAQRGMDPRL